LLWGRASVMSNEYGYWWVFFLKDKAVRLWSWPFTSNVDIKTVWSLASTLLVCLHGMVLGHRYDCTITLRIHTDVYPFLSSKCNKALLHTAFFLDVCIYPEDGGDLLVRNISWLSVDYTALYARR
jgi:hypothetical protein